jgi:hypothetical protein
VHRATPPPPLKEIKRVLLTTKIKINTIVFEKKIIKNNNYASIYSVQRFRSYGVEEIENISTTNPEESLWILERRNNKRMQTLHTFCATGVPGKTEVGVAQVEHMARMKETTKT